MRLIVGLGNFGGEFEHTRHNTGFLVVEQLVRALGGKSNWEVNAELKSEVSNLVFAKPQTLMNSSGRAVRNLIRRLKVSLDDFLLVHDDLDLSLGEFKLQHGRGTAGHRGVKSVVDVLGSYKFWRLRVGIGRPPEGVAVEDYVLGKFSRGELRVLEDLIERELVGVVKEWVGE